ncbi:DUF4252 domain-containing protein [Spongiivirga sp. MCCC 1A20706]|uniref:DUF4252 domain-containing protein n=1 Tax=Spongiivirga sp. MCCC 1A20706 TaxID=3160963 RepID=UPI003977B893
MKKLVLTIAIALISVGTYAQSIFDKYESNPDVAFISVSPKMFKMLGSIGIETDDPEAQEFISLVNSITNFKVITTDNGAISKDITSWVSKHVRSTDLEELMRVRDGDSNVKFYVKEGKDDNHVKELVMFVTGFDQANVNINGKKLETVLLSLSGDIDLRQVGKLTDQMDLPGGKQLKKANKNK